VKVYRIVIAPRPVIGDGGHYVLAEDFDDAYAQAQKLLMRERKTASYASIASVCVEFELEVVK